MKRILIVHLVANGDCLMVTALARQIKHDHPHCKLTWAISYKCKQVIENNPFVDDIWEVTYKAEESPFEEVWTRLKQEINLKVKNGEFHQVYFTQIVPDNIFNYDGSTRSSTFRTYPRKITVPITPVMKLYPYEVEKVNEFVDRNRLKSYKHVILMECAPASGQSFMTQQKALAIAYQLVESFEEALVIISSHIKLETGSKNIIDASELTFRENAELSKYCTFFIGCSSGITWLLTSEWAKKLPSVQLLSKGSLLFYFASVNYDFKHWGFDTSHIIESSKSDTSKAAQLVVEAIQDFPAARSKYHEEFKPDIKSVKIIGEAFFNFRNTGKTISMMANYISRNDEKFSNFCYCLVVFVRLFFKKVVFPKFKFAFFN